MSQKNVQLTKKEIEHILYALDVLIEDYGGNDVDEEKHEIFKKTYESLSTKFNEKGINNVSKKP